MQLAMAGVHSTPCSPARSVPQRLSPSRVPPNTGGFHGVSFRSIPLPFRVPHLEGTGEVHFTHITNCVLAGVLMRQVGRGKAPQHSPARSLRRPSSHRYGPPAGAPPGPIRAPASARRNAHARAGEAGSAPGRQRRRPRSQSRRYRGCAGLTHQTLTVMRQRLHGVAQLSATP